MKKLYLLICAILTLPFAMSATDDATVPTIHEGFDSWTTDNLVGSHSTEFTDMNSQTQSVNWYVTATDAATFKFKILDSGTYSINGNTIYASSTYGYLYVKAFAGTLKFTAKQGTSAGTVKICTATVDEDAKTYTQSNDVLLNVTVTDQKTYSCTLEEDSWICIEMHYACLDDYYNILDAKKEYTVSGKVFYQNSDKSKVGLPNATVSIGITQTKTDENGNYAITCFEGKGRVLTVECPYTKDGYAVPYVSYPVDVTGDTTLDIQVVKGKDGESPVTYFTDDFEDWNADSGTMLSSMSELPNGWILQQDYTTEDRNYALNYYQELDSDQHYLSGPTGNYYPKLIFPAWGSDKNGCNVSYRARGSYANAELIFYSVTKNEDGSFTIGDVLTTISLPSKSSGYQNGSFNIPAETISNKDGQYLALCITNNGSISSLTVSYNKVVTVATSADLSGTVTAGDEPVKGATVTFTENLVPTAKVLTTTTDENGKYSFEGVLTNIGYTITATSDEYKPYSKGFYYLAYEESPVYDIELSNYSLGLMVTDIPGDSSEDSEASFTTAKVTLKITDAEGNVTTKTCDASPTVLEQIMLDKDYSGCTVRVSADGYYQSAAQEATAKDGVNGILVTDASSINVYLQPHKITREMKTNITVNATTGHIEVRFPQHNLSLVDKDNTNKNHTITFSCGTSTEKPAKYVSTAWNQTNLPIDADVKTSEDGYSYLVLTKNVEIGWQYTLKEETSYILNIPASTLLIDDYVYDHELVSSHYIDVETGVFGTAIDADPIVDVYTPAGMIVKRGVAESSLKQLPAGIYIVRGKTKTYKFVQK